MPFRGPRTTYSSGAVTAGARRHRSPQGPGDGGQRDDRDAGPPVPPDRPIGTTSALHRTATRPYDAHTSSEMQPATSPGGNRTIHGHDRITHRLSTPLELGGAERKGARRTDSRGDNH